ncbi:hypothetical protein CR513_26317, partial [Mucuna pruriens]
MDSESKQVKQKLEILDILNEAVTFYVKNINFIIFTFLTSLPFFFVMVYFEVLFQKIMVEIPEIISLLPFNERKYVIEMNFDGIQTIIPDKSFSKNYLPVLIQLGFIYLVPLHVLELWYAVVTIDSASKLRSEENNMSLKDMFRRSIEISIMKGTFITSLLSCISLGCYKGGYGIFVQIGFLTVVNTLKWVSCIIYFYDCKERKMEKKVDEESVWFSYQVSTTKVISYNNT